MDEVRARPLPLPPTIAWVGGDDGELQLLDQTRLPGERVLLHLRTVAGVAEAIASLRVRGAPLIGVAAAYGLYLGVRERCPEGHAFAETVREVAVVLAATRPTAVNLRWALDRCVQRAQRDGTAAALLQQAIAIHREDAQCCAAMGQHGAALVRDGMTVLTHCNTGRLATAGDGTALAVLFAAHAAGRRFRVLADETRPLLQGARLTALELACAGIPVDVLVDGAGPALLARGDVQLVVVGADRIAANGDFANKIGTYSLALAAAQHGVPFYAVAPSSTFDLQLGHGQQIPIEERDGREVLELGGRRIAPAGVGARNPAFDVTPAGLVTGIVTDRGVIRPVTAAAIKATLG